MATDGGVSDDSVLDMWTVYGSSLDYPGQFVARRWVILRGEPLPRPTGDLAIAPSLDGVRAMLPWGLACMTRSEGDDPAIVETWL